MNQFEDFMECAIDRVAENLDYATVKELQYKMMSKVFKWP